MDVEHDLQDLLAGVASAIGQPARARMLSCLMDGRARTSTELALVAGVGPSTASAHLTRLESAGLVRARVQGRHRYYQLSDSGAAEALERLSVLAGGRRTTPALSIPARLRAARTCYDHLAGTLGVALHDRLRALGWMVPASGGRPDAYDLSERGAEALEALGVDVQGARARRRRFAYACLDWSERCSHLGGALGAALLTLALERRWLAREREGRAVHVTELGRRDMLRHFGLSAEPGEPGSSRGQSVLVWNHGGEVG